MKKSTYKISVIQLNINNSPEKNLIKCVEWIKKVVVFWFGTSVFEPAGA